MGGGKTAIFHIILISFCLYIILSAVVGWHGRDRNDGGGKKCCLCISKTGEEARWNNHDAKMFNFEQTLFKCIQSPSIHALNQKMRKTLRSKHSFHFVSSEWGGCLKQVYLIPFSKACFLLVCTGGPQRLSCEVQRTICIIIAFVLIGHWAIVQLL